MFFLRTIVSHLRNGQLVQCKQSGFVSASMSSRGSCHPECSLWGSTRCSSASHTLVGSYALSPIANLLWTAWAKPNSSAAAASQSRGWGRTPGALLSDPPTQAVSWPREKLCTPGGRGTHQGPLHVKFYQMFSSQLPVFKAYSLLPMRILLQEFKQTKLKVFESFLRFSGA